MRFEFLDVAADVDMNSNLPSMCFASEHLRFIPIYLIFFCFHYFCLMVELTLQG